MFCETEKAKRAKYIIIITVIDNIYAKFCSTQLQQYIVSFSTCTFCDLIETFTTIVYMIT